MENEKNIFLQITDVGTGKRCILRIEQDETSLPLRVLLEKYLNNAPIDGLIEDRRITGDSAETLQDIQDLVYVSGDNGQLGDMFTGTVFQQAGRAIALDSVPILGPGLVSGTRILVIDLNIDRTNAGYDRNWAGFHKRRWKRHHKVYSDFVSSSLEMECSQAEAEDILLLSSKECKLRLIQALAKRIWESDFESYSRFTGRKLAHKTGDETVRNIIEGAGGICSEKVQALKFITDHYGLPSEYLFAGVDARGPMPEARLRELLDTFDFRFSKRYMRYWQHTALLYTIEDTTVLVDATNGNIPLLFLTGDAAESVLRHEDKQPVSVRMVDSYEDFYYHRVSQDIPENLFFAMEGWIPYIDLVQVFENELGLYLSADFYVTPVLFRNAREFDMLKQEYAGVCDRAGIECSVSSEWTLDSPLGRQFFRREPQVGERVMLSKDHLLERYNGWDGPGHDGGLVVMKLRNRKLSSRRAEFP